VIKTLTTLGLVAAAALLTACGDQPQEMGGVRSDAAPYTGVGKSQYQQPGWTPGDKNSWEQQLKSRAQYGMNDYTRVSTQ
jgi:outer membrane lipopolysaccharide assembly protein LptE/RlpB